MTTITQNFTLHNTTTGEKKPMEQNFSYLDLEKIRERFQNYIQQFSWSDDDHLVAFGDAGDSVIYEAGMITQVSDSC